MAKYIDADRLRSEIKKSINEIVMGALDHDAEIEKIVSAKYRKDALCDVLSIIDSLQQEVDLKKEVKEWADLMVGASFPEQDGDFISEEDYRSVIRQTAIHFFGLTARKEENK